MSARADKHQRILAELLTRPGNDVCAECRERAPRWSSWNIGIFICVHCASIHRKMGTHISKVKSVTLDTWTKDQVEVTSSRTIPLPRNMLSICLAERQKHGKSQS
ncbi:Arf GTPase activating protein [Clavulina sp. PMI_390]|nr:Arf GTPase activating protein [Clavulina sp. PMI_390]